jgi:hypothetical protein
MYLERELKKGGAKPDGEDGIAGNASSSWEKVPR